MGRLKSPYDLSLGSRVANLKKDAARLQQRSFHVIVQKQVTLQRICISAVASVLLSVYSHASVRCEHNLLPAFFHLA